MPTETIIQLLENGKWHNLSDIEQETQINRNKVEAITAFLANYNFVKLDEKRQKVKLDNPTTKFFKKIRQIENEENIQNF
jgi:DNA-binding IclR family transcriptional regulator